MIAELVEAALRSLLVAMAVWAGLQVFRVRNVLAQKAAWGLVLARSGCHAVAPARGRSLAVCPREGKSRASRRSPDPPRRAAGKNSIPQSPPRRPLPVVLPPNVLAGPQADSPQGQNHRPARRLLLSSHRSPARPDARLQRAPAPSL